MDHAHTAIPKDTSFKALYNITCDVCGVPVCAEYLINVNQLCNSVKGHEGLCNFWEVKLCD